MGELTTVFKSDSHVCHRFFALGPKNYSYSSHDPANPEVEEHSCKVRGLTFNRKTNKIVNVDLMEEILLESIRVNREGTDEEKATLLDASNGFFKLTRKVPRFTIVRGDNRDPFVMMPAEQNKTYQVVFNKRVVSFNDLLAYLFGYIKKYKE